MINLVYIDNHLLIIDKPAGLPTQPHAGFKENATDLAKAWIKRKYGKPGKVFLEPVHRLDTPVSGLVLFARTSKALSRLQAMMRAHEIKKTYYALVFPPPDTAEGVLEHHLVHDEHQARVVPSSHPQGKYARLKYRTISKKGETALLEIHLDTGRYHQIRTQLAAHGCPIVGDKKYGSTKSWKGEGIALRHGRLSFVHPVTKEELVIKTNSPHAWGDS